LVLCLIFVDHAVYDGVFAEFTEVYCSYVMLVVGVEDDCLIVYLVHDHLASLLDAVVGFVSGDDHVEDFDS